MTPDPHRRRTEPSTVEIQPWVGEFGDDIAVMDRVLDCLRNLGPPRDPRARVPTSSPGSTE
ncbi:hypothetical protein [Actinokineospora sp.]|uniref:hypothetical protein n=1 Tax=Actinokineospora sp. TaxID=1872133 RepID=UPI0040379BA0